MKDDLGHDWKGAGNDLSYGMCRNCGAEDIWPEAKKPCPATKESLEKRK